MGEFKVNDSGISDSDPDEIQEILDELLAETDSGNMSQGRIDFIESIYDWYSSKGFLTEAQEAAIRKIHDEVF